MNKTIAFFLMNFLLLSCYNSKKNVQDLSSRPINYDVDSIFFIAPNIFEYKNWVISNSENANILRVVKQDTIKDYFWAKNNNLMHLKLLAEGKSIYPKSLNEKNAKLFGQWKYYGDADTGLYKTGFFLNGIKDSVWYINYEGFPIPLVKFYKEGKNIDYQGELAVYSDTLLLAKGKEVKASGLPLGEWIFNDRQSKYSISEQGDSILIYSLRNKVVIRISTTALDEL